MGTWVFGNIGLPCWIMQPNPRAMEAIRDIYVWIHYDDDALDDHLRKFKAIISASEWCRCLAHVRLTCTPKEGFNATWVGGTYGFEEVMWEIFLLYEELRRVFLSNQADIDRLKETEIDRGGATAL